MPIALHPLLFDGYTEDFEDDAAGGDYNPINWYDTDWSYRQKYEIDDADIDNGANLVDFPVLITINSTTGGKCQADGGDLRFFSDAEGTVELDYDIEDFDGAGNSYVWVEIPSVEDNGAHTTFYMYYGNAGVANGEDESGTWNSNYVGVYHGVDALDATSNNNDGTATGGATYAAGHISNAFSLDGLNDWFSIADSASLDLSTAYTLESWIKPDTTFTNVSHGFFQTIFDKGSYNFFLDKTDGYATAEIMDSTLTFTRVKDLSSKPRMTAGTVFNGLLYAGQAWASNAGDIITWDGSNVATVYDNSYDSVLDMLTWKGKIYAGMGYDAGQGDVLSTPDGTTWDVAYNSGDASYDFTFGLTAYPHNDSIIAFRGGDHAGDERMMESIDGTNWYARYDPGIYMRFQKGFPFTDNKVYFGSGYGANLADVHSYDGSASAKTYDGTSTYEMSASMNMYEGSLYSGFGESSAGEGDIYSSPDGSAWSLSYNAPDGTGGNPNLRGSWDIIYYKGLLWQGYDWTDGRLVYFDGSTWTLVDPYNGGGGYDGMYPLAVYNGDFIVGGGSGTNDGDIFSCDAGDSVKSTTQSFDSGYYNYISSTYDGSNMRMYLNGSLETTHASTRTIETNAEPLYIGSFLGGRDQSGCGWFDGSIDEMRISKTARSAPWLSATYDTMEGSLPDLSGGEETVSISDGIPTSTFYDFTTSQNNGGNDTQVSDEWEQDASEDVSYSGSNSLEMTPDGYNDMNATDGWCTFDFNETGYFMLSFKFHLRPEHENITFRFQNETNDTVYEFAITNIHHPELYDINYDFDGDGEITELDIRELILHYGETGFPGWIPQDTDKDGNIDVNDISIFVANADPTVVSEIITHLNLSGTVDEWQTYASFDRWSNQYLWYDFNIQFEYNDSMDYTYTGIIWKETTDDEWLGYDSNPGYSYAGFNEIGYWDKLNISTPGTPYCWIDDLDISVSPDDIDNSTMYPVHNATDVPVDMTEYCDIWIDNISMEIARPTPSDVPFVGKITQYRYVPDTAMVTADFYPAYSGLLWENSVTYTNVYNDTTGLQAPGDIKALSTYESGQYFIGRSGLIFDTSSIPDGATINNAILSLKDDGDTDNTASGRLYVYYNETDEHPTPILGLDTSDYNRLYYDNIAGYMDDDYGYDINIVFDYDPDSLNCINDTGYTRLLLRSNFDHLGDEPLADWYEYWSFDNTGDNRPKLSINYTYVAGTGGWVPMDTSYEVFYDEATFDYYWDDLSFNTEYYWYVEITAGFGANDTYTWELPDSGSNMGGKYCWHFTTEEFEQPYLDGYSPALNATNVELTDCTYVPVSCVYHSNYDSSGTLHFYYWDTSTHTWESLWSNMLASDGNNITAYFMDADYSTTYNWRVEVWDNCNNTINYYPNDAQSGVHVGAYNTMQFTTKANELPWVYDYYPKNHTSFNPWRETAYINSVDNDTCQMDYVSYNVWWGEYSAVYGMDIWHKDKNYDPHVPNATYYSYPEGFSHSVIEYDINGSWGYYRAEISDGYGGTTKFPEDYSFGTLHNGEYWVNFTVDLEMNFTDFLNITYPTETTYTVQNWRADHILDYTFVQNLNYASDIFFIIKPSWYNTTLYDNMREIFATTTDGITYTCPTSGSIDLSDWLTFEDTSYNISIGLIYHPLGFDIRHTYDEVNFTIGTVSDSKPYHISIKDLNPMNGDFEAYETIADGYTKWFSTNASMASNLIKDRFYYAVRDDNNNKMLTGITSLQNFNDWWNVFTPWHYHSLNTAILMANHLYTIYEGRFMNSSDHDDFQIDMLYDDNATRCWFGMDDDGMIIEGEGYSSTTPYLGWKTSFGYYPDGYTDKNPNPIEDNIAQFNLIIPGGQYIAFALIVVCFTLIPYIVTRRYKKNIPSVVMYTFLILGCLTGYAMGLIDMWIFIIPTILILTMMLYKTIHKFVKGKEEQTEEP